MLNCWNYQLNKNTNTQMSSSVLQKATTFYFACLVGVTSAGFRNSASDIALFSTFSAHYNKNYIDAADAQRHMDNFLNNRAKIQAKNAKHTKARFVIDSFADLSDEEFILQKTGARLGRDPVPLKNTTVNEGNHRAASKKNSNRPPIREVDWTHKMTAVRDQQTCGVCWATSAVSVQEAVHAIQYELSEPVLLSE